MEDGEYALEVDQFELDDLDISEAESLIVDGARGVDGNEPDQLDVLGEACR